MMANTYREAPSERGTFFRLQLYKRAEISQVEVDATYGCISLFIKHYMNLTTRLPFSAIYS